VIADRHSQQLSINYDIEVTHESAVACDRIYTLQGPRIAHWLLPIPKNPKVGSEWWYAWVPVVGPLIGGVLAGAVFRGYVKMLKGQVSTDANPWATTSLTESSVTANLTENSIVDASAAAVADLAAPGSSKAGGAAVDVVTGSGP
jgi:hypothetical protein